MKKAILTAAMLGLAVNAHAVCPPTLYGVWSGTQTNTETGFWVQDNGTIIPTTRTGNGLVTILFSGSTAKLIYNAVSESGFNGGITDYTGEGKEAPFTYDRAKCSAVVYAKPDQKVIFTLTGNGKVLNGISFEKNNCNEDGSQCTSGVSQASRLERQ